MNETTTIHLTADVFTTKERLLVESGPLSASTFIYESGVLGLRIQNEVGELVMLPYQGQQIWSATFNDRNLTMKSLFDQPQPTTNFLDTYGGFFLHCGFTAMGVPSAEDTHAHHGELPNAPYQKAHVIVGEDETGLWIGLGGQYRHTVAFCCDYVAEPLVKLRTGSTLFEVSLTCRNLRQAPMDYMYLAHANFRPVDNGRLVYSADVSPQTVRVRRSIPPQLKPGSGFVEFVEQLAAHPEKHHILHPGLPFNPEIVFNIDYKSDDDGWSHSLHIHPDGRADYIRYRPDQLGLGVRWICRTEDQEAIGLILPATAGPDGYIAEKAKGYVQELAGGNEWHCDMQMGALPAKEAAAMEQKIAAIVAR